VFGIVEYPSPGNGNGVRRYRTHPQFRRRKMNEIDMLVGRLSMIRGHGMMGSAEVQMLLFDRFGYNIPLLPVTNRGQHTWNDVKDVVLAAEIVRIAPKNLLIAVPAYGIDYQTQSGVLSAWQNRRDFALLNSPGGTYVNIDDKPEHFALLIRFDRQVRSVIIELQTSLHNRK
jgi:hypothetical protein